MDDYYEERQLHSQTRKSGKRKKSNHLYLLTTVQITVCVILVIAALIIKSVGGDLYKNIQSWYIKNSSQSIVAQEQIEQVKTQVLDILPPASSAASSSSQLEKK